VLQALRPDLVGQPLQLVVGVCSARARSGPGVVVPGRSPPCRPSEVGSFSAVETVWKFIPKIEGVPIICVRLWLKPSIQLSTAWTL
jgi:hypothetical protein